MTFFSIDNFRSKLQVVDRLVEQKFPQHVKTWEPLKIDTERLSRIRNQLAHYPVMNYVNDAPGSRIALLPRFSARSKFKQKLPKPPSGSLGLRDIVHAEARFNALMFGLEGFQHTLLGDQSIFPASAANAPAIPSLADISRQMRTMQT
ncbi:hypothetical protein [Bradyrhizobium sp. WSM1417]|uniref:hypothetical protein n=1 Tax=Bradyrhizobium sp. WSM1417 TaxID=754500 RepID=UPI000486FF55|nr:hypothetical protein [Bradyrhizobium sp. WSM1417]